MVKGFAAKDKKWFKVSSVGALIGNEKSEILSCNECTYTVPNLGGDSELKPFLKTFCESKTPVN